MTDFGSGFHFLGTIMLPVRTTGYETLMHIALEILLHKLLFSLGSLNNNSVSGII